MSESRKWQDGEFTISTDKNLLQVDEIHKFLSEESYWAKERTIEQTRTAIENSLCFGVYANEKQIGFARVISDYATFAYIGDVYITKEFRGRGLSKHLMKEMLDDPALQNLRRWILATFDAHTLYEQFGFHPLKYPERWLERPAPNAY
ncbi:MAG: GNAT family N-acetyltransferase [Acidobacteriota bacterium]|nr:GNAT family N-acetyltransferase [Acidobacteriota bacterium]